MPLCIIVNFAISHLSHPLRSVAVNTRQKAKRDLTILMEKSANEYGHPDYRRPIQPVVSMASNRGYVTFHPNKDAAGFHAANVCSCANYYP
jgi:hypothetical protein